MLKSLTCSTIILTCVAGQVVCEEPQSSQRQAEIVTAEIALQQKCELRVAGGRVTLEDLIFGLSSEASEYSNLLSDTSNGFSWHIRIRADEGALATFGVEIGHIVIDAFHVADIERRNALRLLLDRHGLSWHLVDDTIFIAPHEAVPIQELRENDRVDVLLSRDADVKLRRDVVFMVGCSGRNPDIWKAALVECLQDPDCDVRCGAAFAIGRMGPIAKDAAASLAAMLHSDNGADREAASAALARLGVNGVQLLAKSATNSDNGGSITALLALRRLGLSATMVSQELTTDLIARCKLADLQTNESELQHIELLASVIAVTSKPSQFSAILDLSASQEVSDRMVAALVASQRSRAGTQVYTFMKPLLFDKSVFVRSRAAKAIALNQVPSGTDLSSLEHAAKDDDKYVALWAKEALRKARNE